MEWKPNGTMRLHPFELIQQEHGIHVRYRNDWHIGAMPERDVYKRQSFRNVVLAVLKLFPVTLCLMDFITRMILDIGLEQKMGIIPVSYTHLPVAGVETA